MAPWKLIRTKEFDALKNEIKGYYEDNEKANLYIASLQKLLKGLQLPPMTVMSRQKVKEAYESIAPVMGVVDYIAQNVGEVGTYFELIDRNYKVVEKDSLLDTLASPNDRFSFRKFLTAWATNKLLFGDAWVYVTETVGKDAMKQLYVIPSHKVGVENGAEVFKGIRLLDFTGDTTIEKEDVFESFDYNLDDRSFFGTSKVVAAAAYLHVIDKGLRRQEKTLDEGGATHIITPKPDMTGSILPEYKEKIKKVANGEIKRGVLDLPIDVHQLGDTPVDLSILDSHKEAVTALCFVYRLPVDLYYGQAKYENAKEAKKTIYEQNAIPLANEFGEDLLRFLAKKDSRYAGYKLRVNTDMIDVLKDKPGETLDNLAKMHATLNEMREAYGYEPIDEPWAGEPILPMGVMFGNEYAYDINEGGNGKA